MPFARVTRIGVFRLPIDVHTAFPFFSPEGERAWAPGWAPTYFTERRAPHSGLAFATDASGEPTLWLVIRYDAATCHARYARIVPGSRMGTVDVRCAPTADGRTEVTVSYDLTALSEAGSRVLDALTPAAYEAMLREWQSAITTAAANGAI